MNEDIVQNLVRFLEIASPVVWAAARKQVILMAIWDGVWTLFFWGLAGGCIYAARRCGRKNEDPYGDYGIILFLSVLGAILFTAAGIACAGCVVGTLINPDYYAVKALIRMFTPS